MGTTVRQETEPGRDERYRDRYRELLEEVRTVIPGAQVLFAFLLAVPFASRFAEVDGAGRVLFAVSLLCVAAAIVLFLSPAAYHRSGARRDRRGRLRFGVRTAIAGMACLAVSMTCVIFVVMRFLFGDAIAAALAGASAAFSVVLWYLVPRSARGRPPQIGA